LRCKASPPFAQDQVVGVLNAQAGGAANQVQRIEQLLNVEEANVQGIFLGGESGFESFRGALMSSTSVMKNNGQFAQVLPALRLNMRFGHTSRSETAATAKPEADPKLALELAPESAPELAGDAFALAIFNQFRRVGGVGRFGIGQE
jgi:hypothetical protein